MDKLKLIKLKQIVIKKKKIIIPFTILFIVTIIYFFYNISRPTYIIKNRIGLELSGSSKVIFYDHTLLGDYVGAKIELSENDLEKVVNQLSDESKFPSINKKNILIPNFQNSYEWFIIKNENLKYMFNSYRTDRKFKDKHVHEIWAFICYEDEEYYLYLSF